jgi:hypothetical protein
MKRLLTLAGVIAAAAVLITSAGAGTGTPTVDLSTRSGAVKFLKSIGVDPKGVVIQRGVRNYAGPSCPGRRWSCTRATRVFQIAATGGTNKFVYSDASGTGSATTTGPTDPLNCSITQTATTGNNVASCSEDESTNPATETCSIAQTNTSGANQATVDQNIKQASDASQSASQFSSIDQANGSGSNTAKVNQAIAQATNAGGDQSQAANQNSCVRQHDSTADASQACTDGPFFDSSTGGDSSTVSQSVQQAMAAGPGTTEQHQNSDISGHVSQVTTGLATNSNSQSEAQAEAAGPRVGQFQSGPLTCCTSQSSNTGDTFNIKQKSKQKTTSMDSQQDESILGTCITTGMCQVTQSASENGSSANNMCSGSSCDIGIVCASGGGAAPTTTGSCTPCTGLDCVCPVPPCIGSPAFVTSSYTGRPVVLAARRLLLRLLH